MMKVGKQIGLFLVAALILSGCSNSAAGSGSSAAQTETRDKSGGDRAGRRDGGDIAAADRLHEMAV